MRLLWAALPLAARGFNRAELESRSNYTYDATVSFDVRGNETEYRTTFIKLAPEHAARCNGTRSCYVVRVEALVRHPALIHHIELGPCPTRQQRRHPDSFQWIRGRDALVFEAPPDASRDVSQIICWYAILHYHNPHHLQVTDTSGLRIYYSTRPRAYTQDYFYAINVAAAARTSVVPPGKTRWYLTKTCEVAGRGEAPLFLDGVDFHAHATGSEMYAMLWRGGNATEMASEENWSYFHPKTLALAEGAPTELRDGDLLQTTCVYNTSLRNVPTPFGPPAMTHEMCLGSYHYHGSVKLLACARSRMWMGSLAEGKDARTAILPAKKPEVVHAAPRQTALGAGHVRQGS